MFNKENITHCSLSLLQWNEKEIQRSEKYNSTNNQQLMCFDGRCLVSEEWSKPA